MIRVMKDEERGQKRNQARTEREGKWLRLLTPLVELLIPLTRRDPVRGLALPTGELDGDASMISVYYLSFYE